MTFTEQIQQAITKNAVNIAYFGALNGMSFDEVKSKALPHTHTIECLRYGNIDIHWYCSENNDELFDEEAEAIISQDKKEHNK